MSYHISKNAVVLRCIARTYIAVWSIVTASVFTMTAATVAEAAVESGIEEVIVTAQKREETLQRTPVAVSVLSGVDLENNLITGVTEVVNRIPGFGFEQQNKTQTAVALRGAGSLEDSPAADGSVGLFVDDVYIANPAAFDFDLLDLERVEVLRGPQGTTFGRNVVGGALNFITRNPTDELKAKAALTMGRFGRFDINGTISGPLIENTLFALASFSSRDSDGYVKNLTTGNKLEQDDQKSGRVKLRWVPATNFEALFSADYSRDKSYGVGRVYIGPDAPVVGSVQPNLTTTEQDLDGGYDRTMWGVNGKLTYSLEEGGEIVSITSYRDSSHTTAFEFEATPFTVLGFDSQNSEIEEFTQELRIVNSWDKLDYIAGLYYFRQEVDRLETISENGQPGSLIDVFFGDILPLTEILGQSVTTDSYAAFAQGTYNITEQVRLTVGGRFTWEKKSGNTLCLLPGLQCGNPYLGEDGGYDQPYSADWDAFTPKVTLDVDIAENIFAYATVSRGFKSGGFASGFEEPESAAVPFDPEYALNYEIGLRSRWFDDRLQLNATGFYVEYTDLQARLFLGGEQSGRVIVGNAGEAHNTGLELEMVAKPAPSLELWLNYTYQDGEYDSLELEGEDYSGNTLALTPRNSVSLGGEYTHELANDGEITLRADYTYKSKYFSGPDNNPLGPTEYDGIVNASIAYTFPNQHWELQFSGKNLTNNRVPLSTSDYSVFVLPIDDFFAGGLARVALLTPPRTWTATLRFMW